MAVPDFSKMSNAEIVAYLRGEYGNIGKVNEGYDQATGSLASVYADKNPAMALELNQTGKGGGYRALLGGLGDGGGNGNQYGGWWGTFDANGNMVGDPEWNQAQRQNGGWLADKGWMIPLMVAGGAAAGIGSGAASTGANIAGSSMAPQSLAEWQALDMAGQSAAEMGINVGDVVGSDWAAGAATGAQGGLLPSAGGMTLANGAGAATTFGNVLNALGGAKGVAALAGGVLGAAAGKSGSTASQTTTKDPWGPAQDWLKQQITTGQALQNYYQKNPLNDIQKTAYQNQLSDTDAFRSSIAPQLFGLANSVATPYQRTAGPAATGTGGATGLLDLKTPSGKSYGTIDWDKLNPYKNGLL